MEIAIALLQHYNFDLGGYTIRDLTRSWADFRPEWVRQAVIEALFQGRYKAVSVNQILQAWDRKNEANCHFNREFERLVCGDVAVIYEDRIYYKPSRTANREVAIAEISPFTPTEALINPIPFPHRSIKGNSKATPTYQAQNQTTSKIYPSQPVGTTANFRPLAPQRNNYSEVYQSAYENMALLAESSMFVDKLRSMCIPSSNNVSAENKAVISKV
ncbi:hypothetical protein HCU40_17140 [Pseudanabaena biceps]|nr:hypothetical protein [Pseudanabaena biceps]